MIASLMMYARPELEGAHNRFWALIRAGLLARDVPCPADLSQSAEEFSVWEHPDLVLSQTCGMPYRCRLSSSVSLVGTPDYGLKDCSPGYYRSAFLVRCDDLRGTLLDYRDRLFAYNQLMSQSGYAAPFEHAKGLGFWFEHRLETGAHVESARAVADGRADIAALDAVTWRLICEHESFAQGLRVLEWTLPTPGLPLITAQHDRVDSIFSAVGEAIAALDPADKLALGLRGIVAIPKSDYLAVPNPE